MKESKLNLHVYRSLYWANQGLLHAARAIGELDQESSSSLVPASATLRDKLRRTQAMIEETRLLMNRNLAEWIEPKNSTIPRK